MPPLQQRNILSPEIEQIVLFVQPENNCRNYGGSKNCCCGKKQQKQINPDDDVCDAF